MNTPRRRDEIAGKIIATDGGLEVADNRLPAWWLWIFYGAIVFAAGYWLYYESFAIGLDPLGAYNAERLASLDTGEPVTEAELEAMMADRLSLAAGAKLFARSCSRCHHDQGQGAIGPNLTDAYWIGGATGVDIYETIYSGRAGRGMAAWGPVVGRGAVMQVAAFVMTLKNTNIEGREPQGTLWKAEPAPADTPPASESR